MSAQPTPKNHLVAALACAAVVVGMVGMSYAAVPLYQLFCQITGYAGTTQRADAPSGTVLDRTITVRFDGNVSNELDWEFRPKQRDVTMRIGETAQIAYEALNTGRTPSFGTATFNVSPGVAGAYFNKIECFCFTQQELAAGESVEMPVIFFVDPEIVNDPLLKNVRTITLSYTFFPDDTADARLSENGAAPAGEKTDSSL